MVDVNTVNTVLAYFIAVLTFFFEHRRFPAQESDVLKSVRYEGEKVQEGKWMLFEARRATRSMFRQLLLYNPGSIL